MVCNDRKETSQKIKLDGHAKLFFVILNLLLFSVFVAVGVVVA